MLEVKNVLLLCCARVTGSGRAHSAGTHRRPGTPAGSSGFVFFGFIVFCFFFFAFSLAAEASSGCKPDETLPVVTRRPRECLGFATTSGKAWLFVPLTTC